MAQRQGQTGGQAGSAGDVALPAANGPARILVAEDDPATRLIPVILLTAIGEEYKPAGIERFEELTSWPEARTLVRMVGGSRRNLDQQITSPPSSKSGSRQRSR